VFKLIFKLADVQTAILLKKHLVTVLNKRKAERGENELSNCRKELLAHTDNLRLKVWAYVHSYINSGKTDLSYNTFMECEINSEMYSWFDACRIRNYMCLNYEIRCKRDDYDDGEKYDSIDLFATIFSKRYLNPRIKKLNLVLPVVPLEV
jgi:hypothetical protein